MGVLPSENLVHIDPDFFKNVMPEWRGFTAHNAHEAGTMCHKESCFLQELGQTIAMRDSQHTWIDGSLGDYEWYTKVFANIRTKYPQYRIALIYVYCSEEEVYRRAKRRGDQTGRYVPEDTLKFSLKKTRESFDILGELADFVALINNERRTPYLEHCLDRSGSYQPLKAALAVNDGHRPAVGLEPNKLISGNLEMPVSMLQKPNNEKARRLDSLRLQTAPASQVCRGELRQLLGDALEAKLCFSPPGEIVFSLHGRRVAGISEDARTFIVCHGACDNDGYPIAGLVDDETVPSEARALLDQTTMIFCDEGGVVVGASTVHEVYTKVPAHCIQVGRSHNMTSLQAAKFAASGRWFPIRGTKSSMDATARAFLVPGDLAECPFGALAYKLEDNSVVFKPILPPS